MVQNLSIHSKKVAALLFWILYGSLIGEAWAGVRSEPATFIKSSYGFRNNKADSIAKKGLVITPEKVGEYPKIDVAPEAENKVYIGGPSQPEMSSFKSVGVDNMVDLFTGDFSYNIPLLDVGGYPVNIHYSAGIEPEQEASWVGLGWNINPGNINRNARGVPDDFNGLDTLKQEQNVRVNKTFGIQMGGDIEILGSKLIKSGPNLINQGLSFGIGTSIGMSYNNQLGPAWEFGGKFNLSYNFQKAVQFPVYCFFGGKIVQILDTIFVPKSLTLGAGYSFKNSSRTGLVNSFSSSINFRLGKLGSIGLNASTSYNSRIGIKAIQISGNASANLQSGKRFWMNSKGVSEGASLYGTSITFVKPSFIPMLQSRITNTGWAGRFQLGVNPGSGITADIELEIYSQSSGINGEDIVQKKPLYGFLYSEIARGDKNAVMDFNRLNDRVVTPSTPILSAPQYNYDIFNIQGEGTGGTFRAYRNDVGYMHDNRTESKDKSLSAGVDIGPWGHYGFNLQKVKTPTVSGDWEDGNFLRNSLDFTGRDTLYPTFENVYFRNPGEVSIVDNERLKTYGYDKLVRFQLEGTNEKPEVRPILRKYDSYLNYIGNDTIKSQRLFTKRNKRSQVITVLTAKEASLVGLEKKLRSYSVTERMNSIDNTLKFVEFSRIDNLRKEHHISEITVTETDGKRYVYGIPVYNNIQQDFTFSVNNVYTTVPEKVSLGDQQFMTTGSPLLGTNSSKDGYVQITSTPGYSNSFLLSALLSPDYVDLTNNGVTEDDLGEAVKFNYSRIGDAIPVFKKWRTPLTNGDSVNFIAGQKTEVKDDKGFVAYGERESWYLNSIESKNMIAVFYLSNRDDSKGAASVYGGIDASDTTSKKLDSIDLFNKADLKKNGINGAKPIKTVHFRYSYKLANNTPDHPVATNGQRGKLTLDSLYFTYSRIRKKVINKYIFKYNYNDSDISSNPDYKSETSDRWKTYKPSQLNPNQMRNADFPYVPQDRNSKPILDNNAGAWSLKRVVLPSGGEISVQYESDDYAYVQNKKAAMFMRVVGFASSSSGDNLSSSIYDWNASKAKSYVFIRVPVGVSSVAEIKEKYIDDMDQIAFNLMVNMPKGKELVRCYSTINEGEYGVSSSSSNIIWIKLEEYGGQSVITSQVLEYLLEELPGQAFPGYDLSGQTQLKKIADIMASWTLNIQMNGRPPKYVMMTLNKAKTIDTISSFARLNVPYNAKYGGGLRVKSIRISDAWDTLTAQFRSTYGLDYQYTTTEVRNGKASVVSSGVASYEPSIGNEENPFQKMVKYSNRTPLGPTDFGAVELPVLDAFFQAPIVGYSKVSVSSMKKDKTNSQKSRSKTGRQVTSFYTAKDFPTLTQITKLEPSSMKEFHQAEHSTFFRKHSFDYKAVSQGFLVVLNDMHGKMKNQISYSDLDSSTIIGYTENYYKNTGKNGLADTFSFISNDSSGKVINGNLGVDIELMTDTRENFVKSKAYEGQANIDFITLFGAPIPLPFYWPVSGNSESLYRAVTTTKVVNYHAILDSVVVNDKGSVVSTKNIAYDFYTGDVLVNRTNNEFDKALYSTSYPAHWAYSGMAPAYKNIGTYASASFVDGQLVGGTLNSVHLESGDELYIESADNALITCNSNLAMSPFVKRLWVVDKNKNATSLTNMNKVLYFMDDQGKLANIGKAVVRIIRSGKRNLLGEKVATVLSAGNPIQTGYLVINDASKVINSGAVEYKEKWLSEKDILPKVKVVFDETECRLMYTENESGNLEPSINPYVKGLLGNFKPFRSLVFYNKRKEKDTLSLTNTLLYGYLDSFNLYWAFDVNSNLYPITSNSKWVWNSKLNHINSKGLEIETMDALGIYSSAIYGFNKTLPLALASNSRYYEFTYDGFEDYEYGESINRTKFNNVVRPIDILKATNLRLVNTDTLSFKSHTGKYVVGVEGTSVLALPVQPTYDNFSLNNSNVVSSALVKGTLGGTIDSTWSSASFSGQTSAPNTPKLSFSDASTVFNTGSTFGGVEYTVGPYIPNSYYTVTPSTVTTYNYSYYIRTKQYMEIKEDGYYTFNSSSSNSFYSPSGNAPFPLFNSLTITDTVNNIVYTGTALSSTTSGTSYIKSRQFCLPRGLYVVKADFLVQRFNYSCTPNGACNYYSNAGVYLMQDKFAVYDTKYPSSNSIQFFRSYSLINNCNYTTPFPATDSMRKATFSLIPGKKMLLSVWVRENCGNASGGIPCKESSYNKNQIKLRFNGSFGLEETVFKPSGSIIDGWQKYECVFTVPNGTVSGEVNFVNTSGSTLYFDDFRIHPFNSNIKSFVYDPINLRVLAELDANNFASFYEYDPEGVLVRTKVETKDGIKTISESRSALQKKIK